MLTVPRISEAERIRIELEMVESLRARVQGRMRAGGSSASAVNGAFDRHRKNLNRRLSRIKRAEAADAAEFVSRVI